MEAFRRRQRRGIPCCLIGETRERNRVLLRVWIFTAVMLVHILEKPLRQPMQPFNTDHGRRGSTMQGNRGPEFRESNVAVGQRKGVTLQRNKREGITLEDIPGRRPQCQGIDRESIRAPSKTTPQASARMILSYFARRYGFSTRRIGHLYREFIRPLWGTQSARDSRSQE